jgi:putative transposase
MSKQNTTWNQVGLLLATACDGKSIAFMPFEQRRTGKLRKGRISDPSARYFLTWCVANQAPSLADESTRATAQMAVANIDASGAGRVLAANIMPDHVHLLMELGHTLAISQIVGRTKSAVSRRHRDMKWQENFFEHHLRATESAEDYAFYIFMNPYRARICRMDKSWSGWMGAINQSWRFEEKLCEGRFPQPE